MKNDTVVPVRIHFEGGGENFIFMDRSFLCSNGDVKLSTVPWSSSQNRCQRKHRGHVYGCVTFSGRCRIINLFSKLERLGDFHRVHDGSLISWCEPLVG